MREHLIKLGMLIMAIVIILFVWFGLRTADNQAAEIDKLKQALKEKDNQIEYLQHSIQEQDETVQESENQRIEEVVSVFVRVFYDVREDTYEERQKDAEAILTEDMYKAYFHEDASELLYENLLGNDVRIYTRQDGENASAIAVFGNTMVNTANGERDRYQTTVEVFLTKEGDDWKVHRFEQLMAEPL